MIQEDAILLPIKKINMASSLAYYFSIQSYMYVYIYWGHISIPHCTQVQVKAVFLIIQALALFPFSSSVKSLLRSPDESQT